MSERPKGRPVKGVHDAQQDDERQHDERVSLIRPERIVLSLTLITVAIIWLAIDNRLGLVTSISTPTPLPASVRDLPALSTPVTQGGITANAKLVGRQRQVAGLTAQHGSRYLLIAILLHNGGSRPLAVTPGDFQILWDRKVVAGAVAYPGHEAALTVSALAPAREAQGILLFAVPDGLGPAVLRYTPGGLPGARAFQWRLL